MLFRVYDFFYGKIVYSCFPYSVTIAKLMYLFNQYALLISKTKEQEKTAKNGTKLRLQNFSALKNLGILNTHFFLPVQE